MVEMLRARKHRDQFDNNVDQELGANPEVGDLMEQTGGFRKMRVARPDRVGGKSGGARVIYLLAPAIQHAFLATVYTKGTTQTISAEGKNVLRAWAAELKKYRPSRTRHHHPPAH